MKSINPLHIIILLFVTLVFFKLELNKAEGELTQTKETYQKTLALTTSLKNLNDIYKDKKGVKRSIDIVLKQNSLKKANIKKSLGKSSITISSQSMDRTALNSLMSKVLNGSYNISSLKVKKLSSSKVSLNMEIKW